jgi:hypothetical protein
MTGAEYQAGAVLGSLVRLMILMGIDREELADVLRDLARQITEEAAEQ